MGKLWLYLVPDLSRIHSALRAQALRTAGRSSLQSGELVVMGIWLMVVFIATRAILQGATDENRLLFTIVTNMLFTAPMLLLVFIPIHVRRIRRDIRRQISR